MRKRSLEDLQIGYRELKSRERLKNFFKFLVSAIFISASLVIIISLICLIFTFIGIIFKQIASGYQVGLDYNQIPTI